MPVATATKPTTRATGTRFEAADSDDKEAPKARGMRGSKLLGDVSDDPIGPLDRRSRFADRRGTPRGERRTSIGALNSSDDDHDNEPVQTLRGGNTYIGGSDHSAPNAMAPLLMALAVIGLIGKCYYLSSFITKPDVLMANLPATVDQVTSMLVMVGIILFAMKASQKS
jgi:hypothetical protein